MKTMDRYIVARYRQLDHGKVEHLRDVMTCDSIKEAEKMTSHLDKKWLDDIIPVGQSFTMYRHEDDDPI